MNYESLIFDIDGTLWDSRSLVAVGYNSQLKAEGLEQFSVTPEDLKRLFGKTMTDIADILFHSLPQQDRYPLMERCMQAESRVLHSDPCHIGYPGVVETIAKLSEKHRIFIVSNSQSGYPQLCMEKMGLTPYISGHLCFGDTGTSKGRTIRTLMEKHGIENAVYIGDTQGDYEATLEAGVPFIWCTFGFGTPDAYVAKVDKFEELLSL